jgi:endonuclease/exonuclease/phosphatase family metal-dependent hydrolase
MTLSFLQLNTNSDNFWDKLTSYLRTHQFDILHLQEITGPGTRVGNVNSQRDTYQQLQTLLGNHYNSELSIAETFTSSKTSYFGNATFYKKTFKCLSKNILYLHQNTKPFPSESKEFDKHGRTVLHLELEINGKPISFLNTHLAWSPTAADTPIKLEQGQKLVNYVQKLKQPFILTGDFNVDANSQIIKSLNEYAKNLTTQNKITNTLNPNLHKAKHLFPPGLAVDFIFVSPEIKTENFQLITEDISDHYALTANFSF